MQILAHTDLQLKPCERFFDTFSALRDGLADYAVIPIENTLHGSVHENYDLLVQFEAPILAETQVRIIHNLIGRPRGRQRMASIARFHTRSRWPSASTSSVSTPASTRRATTTPEAV